MHNLFALFVSALDQEINNHHELHCCWHPVFFRTMTHSSLSLSVRVSPPLNRSSSFRSPLSVPRVLCALSRRNVGVWSSHTRVKPSAVVIHLLSSRTCLSRLEDKRDMSQERGWLLPRCLAVARSATATWQQVDGI